jgi:hypothetical protein
VTRGTNRPYKRSRVREKRNRVPGGEAGDTGRGWAEHVAICLARFSRDRLLSFP